MTIIRFLAERLLVYLAAVLVAYALAVLVASQHVANRLVEMGMALAPVQRLGMVVDDLLGMAGMFLPMVAFGLLLAFLVTALLCRWLPQWRLPLYALAGATALVAIHVALQQAFGLTPVAVARSPLGLAGQALAGAAGGLSYILLLRRLAGTAQESR